MRSNSFAEWVGGRAAPELAALKFPLPGQTQFTRMSAGPWSMAIARVMLTTAPFEAQ
jgi:hypothetical protein